MSWIGSLPIAADVQSDEMDSILSPASLPPPAACPCPLPGNRFAECSPVILAISEGGFWETRIPKIAIGEVMNPAQGRMGTIRGDDNVDEKGGITHSGRIFFLAGCKSCSKATG